MNLFVNFLIRPRRLPKLDFSGGIPADCATMVVVPTLLLSESQVRKSVDDLEVRYLANSDPNLHFALLTDSRDAAQPSKGERVLVSLCANLVERLNNKYLPDHGGRFFLFHRDLVYNPVEEAWMGWERKRGKLLDLNNLLRGGFDSFPTKVGDLSILPRIRYVITLDADTQLPREAGAKLVGALAHPLNRAIVDRRTRTVMKGYGILQPRVSISVSSASRSRLASIYSGQTGFDLYTHATSDVYQDLFGEGSFTGKGIYEVDVFQQVLSQRFPANALLSHDLIEGSYARAGLVSDVEVIDEYPSHFSAYSRRKHRWVRGDWQILRWLFGRVPGYSGERAPNPLPFISRWKILDNLRRSLIEAATLALLVCGWFVLPGGPVYWTIATLVLIELPSYLQLLTSLPIAMGAENWPGAVKQSVKGFVAEQVNIFFILAFLLHQALVTLDAIVRTLIRLVVTHRKLLEWETAAESELGGTKRTPVEFCLDLTPWVSLGLAVGLAWIRPHSLPEALPFLAGWAFSGAIRNWIDSPLPRRRYRLSGEDEQFLRQTALCTWRFFREWTGKNGLIPDNVPEGTLVPANVVSPTNLGLLLTAKLAAFDLGYITADEFARETELTLSTALQLARFKGHFYNWNDTQTLQPLPPLFISTVDSGNLAACLWILKQGCADVEREPLFRKSYWNALRDHLTLLRERAAGQASFEVHKLLDEVGKIFESLGDETPAWILSFPELEDKLTEIVKRLQESDVSPERQAACGWASELRARLAAVRAIAENFTPWLLPKYRAFFLRPDTRPPMDPAEITLRALPQALNELRCRLNRLCERDDIHPNIRSNARTTLGVIQTCTDRVHRLVDELHNIAALSETLAAQMNFRFLYNPIRRILSIGYRVADQRLERACYDLLASEARTATFVAIAKGDIEQQSWFQLGRRHTVFHGQRALMSWSGTMFEYLMPALWTKSYGDTILGQSQHAALRCQQVLASKAHRPWGVSEAGFARRDAAGRYQYQPFGLPPLSLRQDITSDVVAPYATFLALPFDPQAAVRNLKRMKKMGWFGAYGFYESADYNPPAKSKRVKYELVRSWMAHHQGMILLALCNQLSGCVMQRRFHAEPRVQATEFILHEHVPDSMPVAPAEAPLLPKASWYPGTSQTASATS
jgi:cyclic beta-1,2-glucan synthetase